MCEIKKKGRGTKDNLLLFLWKVLKFQGNLKLHKSLKWLEILGKTMRHFHSKFKNH